MSFQTYLRWIFFLWPAVISLNANAESRCRVRLKVAPQESVYQDLAEEVLRQKGYVIENVSTKEVGFNFRNNVGGNGCTVGSSLHSCSVKVEGLGENFITGNSSRCVADGHSSWESDVETCAQALRDVNVPSCSQPEIVNFEPCRECTLSYANVLEKAGIVTVNGLTSTYTAKTFTIRLIGRSRFKVSTFRVPERDVAMDMRKVLEPHQLKYPGPTRTYLIIPLDEEANLFAVWFKTSYYQNDERRDGDFVSIINVRENAAKAAPAVIKGLNVLDPDVAFYFDEGPVPDGFLLNRFVFDPGIAYGIESRKFFLKYDWVTNSLRESSYPLPHVGVMSLHGASSKSSVYWMPLSPNLALGHWGAFYQYIGGNAESIFYDFSKGTGFSLRDLMRSPGDLEPGDFEVFTSGDSLLAMDQLKREIWGYSLADISAYGKNAPTKFKLNYSEYPVHILDAMIGTDTFVVKYDDSLALLKVDSNGAVFVRKLVSFSLLNRSVRGGEAAYERTLSYENGKLKFKVISRRLQDVDPVKWVVDVFTGKSEKLGRYP